MNLFDFNKCIERMREIYPFTDENTEVSLVRDLPSNRSAVAIETIDDETKVLINLQLTPHIDPFTHPNGWQE